MANELSARGWLEDALGRYQVTHIHSSVRAALKAMDVTEEAPEPTGDDKAMLRKHGKSSREPKAPTGDDYERCANCNNPISEGRQGWVHEDSDQRSCERAEPKAPEVAPQTWCSICGNNSRSLNNYFLCQFCDITPKPESNDIEVNFKCELCSRSLCEACGNCELCDGHEAECKPEEELPPLSLLAKEHLKEGLSDQAYRERERQLKAEIAQREEYADLYISMRDAKEKAEKERDQLQRECDEQQIQLGGC